MTITNTPCSGVSLAKESALHLARFKQPARWQHPEEPVALALVAAGATYCIRHWFCSEPCSPGLRFQAQGSRPVTLSDSVLSRRTYRAVQHTLCHALSNGSLEARLRALQRHMLQNPTRSAVFNANAAHVMYSYAKRPHGEFCRAFAHLCHAALCTGGPLHASGQC